MATSSVGTATSTPLPTSTAANSNVDAERKQQQITQAETEQLIANENCIASASTALNKKLLLCRRFKDSGGIFRNFNSLPLFVYATSPSTHATSADGVGVSREAAASVEKNDAFNFAHTRGIGAVDGLPLSGSGTHSALTMTTASASTAAGGITIPPTAIVLGVGGVSYQHHLNLSHPHHHLLNSSHTPYSNNYPLQHSSSHHNIHGEQTKSLQELQHEVGALLEFRDLVIETFPDLRHKMASMSSSSSAAVAAVGSSSSTSVSNTNTLTGGVSNTSLASRREWEPGIRNKRKISQKEPSTSTSATTASTTTTTSNTGSNGAAAAGELSSSSLTRSRSNSHSGKKEPKSGENNNGSVVQDSGFSTETSSSKEGHSASSTNGALTGAIALNRLSCPESDDELLNLLDVIHRKSNRLREEMEHLQNYERQNLHAVANVSVEESVATTSVIEGVPALIKSNSGNSSVSALTPKTFREHVERLNKEDIKQLRKERDRLLDKLAEMEAETLTGRIKAAKMNDQMEELISVKKDLEEQLKLAMAQKLELSARVQQLQLQQQQQQSKSSSSQSDYSSQRNFLSSATTVLSTGSGASHLESAASTTAQLPLRSRQNTFQPVVIEQQPTEEVHFAFHQSAVSDNKQQQLPLGRLDGVVSTPGARNTKCRMTDSKRFTAILLETSVIELQRHLLTLTVQNQVLMQKLEQSTKSKTHLAKRLDRSSEDVEDLRFQLEEKNIELEGTKAQLRVLESRIHSSTPSSGAATNSYLQHSQNDYETNRSSASTTLMLSRLATAGDSNNSYMRSATPTSQSSVGQRLLPNNVTQISTPSMKAMVHLHMDEIQQHSSSTESAHEHEILQQQQLDTPQSGGILKLLSTSVGGVSPFEQHLARSQQQQQMLRKFGATSKPSKIPLPGNKAPSFFAGKPPTGRTSTAGRSPPSVNALSRSTGNLLSKSPNSMKRTDSAQSKDNNNSSSSTSSFSNNTSRSSNGSSIPMATTPYIGGAKSHSSTATTATTTATTTPSTRVLQNSPLPKLKRESLTSRVRHLDSLSRVQQQQCNSNSSYDASDASNASPSNSNIGGGGSYLVSSTPKPSAIAAHFNAVLRKDTTLNTSTSPQQSQFLRRNVTGATTQSTAARRFSAAAAGNRVPARSQEQQNAVENGVAPINGGGAASDSDSGKVRTLKSTFLGWLKI